MKRKTNSTKLYTDKSGNIREYKYFEMRRKVAPGEYKKFRGKSEKEAREKYEQYMREQAAAAVPAAEKPLSALMESFLMDFFIKNPRYKESTKQRYIDAYNRTIAADPVADMPVKDIKSVDIQRAYNNMSCAASTIDQANKLLRLFYAHLDKNGIAGDITGALVIPGKKNTRQNDIEIWSDRELYLILSNLRRKSYTIPDYPAHFSDPAIYSGQIRRGIRKDLCRGSRRGSHFDTGRIAPIICTLAGTGARISEVLALEWSDITPDGITINKQIGYSNTFESGKRIKTERTTDSAPKSKSSARLVPITEDLRRILDAYRKQQKAEARANGYKTPLIFTTKSGNPYERATLRKTFNRYYARLNIQPRGFHCYRHTYGSTLAASGAAIQVVSKLLGHDSIETTAKYYIRVDHEQKQNAVNLLRI